MELLAEALRKQRRILDDLLDSTSSRSGETTEILNRIEDLRRRCDETQRRFEASVREAAARDRR